MDSTQTLSKMHTFTMTPNSIVNDPRLSLADKGLALILHSKPDGWVFHTDNLTTLSSNGLDATRGALKRLEDLGYIKRSRKQGSDGKIVGMEITLLNEPQREKPQMVLTSEGKSLRGKIPLYSNTDIISNTDNNNKTDNKSPLTPQGEVEVFGLEAEEAIVCNPTTANRNYGFDEFWKAYPNIPGRKVGKAKCLEIWKRNNLCEHKDRVIKALEQDKATDTWTKECGKFTPMAATWLNRKRHLDIEDASSAKEATTTVNTWTVLTYNDVDLGRTTEWLDKFSAGKPPAWSIRDDEWVSKNRDLIIRAEKI